MMQSQETCLDLCNHTFLRATGKGVFFDALRPPCKAVGRFFCIKESCSKQVKESFKDG